MRSIATLTPFARNSRTHSEAQIQQLIAIIREFGFTVPLLTDADGQLYAGHARVIAAERLGIAKLPTIDISYLSEQQRRALVIADNKIALNAGWDDEILATELAELDLEGFDLSLSGFTDNELSGLGVGGLGDGGDAPRQTAPASWAVVVDCADEAAQVALIAQLEAEGLKCKGTVG
jgi:ParB-like chromosome segregation protein Spo0J